MWLSSGIVIPFRQSPFCYAATALLYVFHWLTDRLHRLNLIHTWLIKCWILERNGYAYVCFVGIGNPNFILKRDELCVELSRTTLPWCVKLGAGHQRWKSEYDARICVQAILDLVQLYAYFALKVSIDSLLTVIPNRRKVTPEKALSNKILLTFGVGLLC